MCIRDRIGIANSDDEQKKVIDIASDVYGVEGVIDYITIKAPLN